MLLPLVSRLRTRAVEGVLGVEDPTEGLGPKE